MLRAHAAGRRTILIVDEAQNLSPAVLEQVRLLTNLETAKQKLLQIILIGQPELRELLARNDLRQLAQRITGRYHLEPLTREETAQYIEHRLKVAGAVGELFDSGAKKETFRLSQGVPRLINVISDRALLGAYSRESRRVDRRLIRRAAAEVHGQLQRSPWLRPVAIAAGLAGLAIIAATVWSGMQSSEATLPAAAAVAAEEMSADAAAAVESVVAAENLTAAESNAVAESAEAGPDKPEPTLSEQLKLAEELTNTGNALGSLFAAWGLGLRQQPQRLLPGNRARPCVPLPAGLLGQFAADGQAGRANPRGR